MTTTLNLRAAALAVLVTVATVGSLNGIANSEHRQAVAAANETTLTAAAEPAVQQIVIVGRRAKA